MHLASISNQIVCYDWPNCNIVKSYNPNPDSTAKLSASWANSAEWMALVTDDGKVEVVSFKDPKCKFLHEIDGIKDASYATFQYLNKRDLTIAVKDMIMLYDMKKGYVKKEIGPTPDHSKFSKVLFDSQDTYLCASTKNNRIYVYDSNGLSCELHASNTGALTNFTVNDTSGLKIAACTSMGACILWELDGITNIYNDITKCPISDLVYRNNSIIYITEAGHCVVRDCYNTSTISKINLNYKPKCVDISADCFGLAICAEDSTIYSYDTRNLTKCVKKTPPQEGAVEITQITFSKRNLTIEPVASKCTKQSRLSPDNCHGDDIEIVHEYNSLISADDESKSSIPHPTYNSVNLKLENLPVLCEINEDPEMVQALTQYSHIEDTSTESSSPTNDANYDYTELIKTTIKEEMAQVTTDLKRQLQKAVLDATRTNFYELRVGLVKEFIKVQDILDSLAQYHRKLSENCSDVKS